MLWRIIDLYVRGGHLGFWKSHAGGDRPPGLNFIETFRTIEKNKETIVTGPNKVTGSCHWTIIVSVLIFCWMSDYAFKKFARLRQLWWWQGWLPCRPMHARKMVILSDNIWWDQGNMGYVWQYVIQLCLYTGIRFTCSAGGDDHCQRPVIQLSYNTVFLDFLRCSF